MLEILNECNADYRWTKFFIVIDGDNRLLMDSDVSWEGSASEKLVLISFIRAMEIAKKAHPKIMKGIWG